MTRRRCRAIWAGARADAPPGPSSRQPSPRRLDAGQLQWVAEHDPAAGVARLQDVVTADPDVATWAVFDWVGLTDVAVAVAQHEALRALSAAHPLVAATGVVEPEPSYWPPLAQQWQMMATIQGMIRLGQGGLVLSRVTPMPST